MALFKIERTKSGNVVWTEELDDFIRDSVANDRTVQQIADDLELPHTTIRARKSTIGARRNNCIPFTDEEKKKIKEFYEANTGAMDLESFAHELGRPKTSISMIAGKMGLTTYFRPLTEEQIEVIRKNSTEYLQTHEHPRGMLGKYHTEESREKMSVSQKIRSDNMTWEEKHDIAMKRVETARKNGTLHQTSSNAYSRTKSGKRADLDNQFFRSAWEANVARILNHLNIKWEYEIKRFYFDEKVDNVESYQPDFYLPDLDKWIEVKGWMDEKSKIRLQQFEKEYPEENNKLILIDQEYYAALRLEYFNLPHWEDFATYLKKPRKEYHIKNDILKPRTESIAS